MFTGIIEELGSVRSVEQRGDNARIVIDAKVVIDGTNAVIVGHAYPFYSLAGGQYLDEGQAAVVRPGGAGIQILARVGLKEWRELAALPR